MQHIWWAWDTTDERCNKYLNDKAQKVPRVEDIFKNNFLILINKF